MSDHVVESTFELSALMKAGVMAGSERDSGSCSGADEDSRSGLHSPTGSEDSVEVQVTPISLRNKRKLAEPRKIQETSVIATPLKKRRFDPISEHTTVEQEETTLNTPSPFRPWIPVSRKNESKPTVTLITTSSTTTLTVSNTTTITAMVTSSTVTSTTSPTKASSSDGEEEKKEETDGTVQRLHDSMRKLQHPTGHDRSIVSVRREPRQKAFESPTTSVLTSNVIPLPHPRLQEEPLSLVVRDEAPRVPSHPAVSGTYEKTPSYMMEHLLASSGRGQIHQQNHPSHRSHPTVSSTSKHHHQSGQQRNYKNMTRERRIEANARERTRVHTISAAFDTLRHAIPAYSHNQKLSKLSVLRIACSYIMTLSKILEKDDEVTTTTRTNCPTGLSGCVDLVSRTIQTEGKLRKRKDD